MNEKNVLVLQHVAVETLGAIDASLLAAGIAFRYVRPYLGETIPTRLEKFGGLIVLGGPMGVYETDAFPHLRDELRLIEQALTASLPILGICLGSQLLAHALGANVRPGSRKEIGWHRVTMTPDAATDPIWRNAPASFIPLHWHGDIFDLPSGATLLASSELTPHQAFRYGANAYGTLFHIETTESLLSNMINTFADELTGAGLSGEQIAAEAPSHWGELQQIRSDVLRQWAGLISDDPQAERRLVVTKLP